MDRTSNPRQLALLCALLVGVTLATFWPVLHHEFINYDDQDYVTENDWVKAGLTRDGVKWAFTTGHASNWHPVTWLSHMLDVQWFGLDAGKHHMTNLLFHAANGVLLLLLLWQMTGAIKRSALVAALFALHPLHVESMAWVAERKDVLSTFFGLLCLLAYAKYTQTKTDNLVAPSLRRFPGRSEEVERRRSRVWYVIALVCFALGLMSKPMLVTWPCVMLLLDFWPLARFNLGKGGGSFLKRLRPLLLEKIPFFALVTVSCGVTLVVQQTAMSGADLPISDRVGNSALAYVAYLKQTIWPAGLAVFYPYASQTPVLKALGAIIVLIVITLGVFRQREKVPSLLTGWFWYLGTLVPVIGLVQVGSQARADRYTYVPLIGIFIMVAWGVTFLLSHSPRLKQLFAIGAIFVIAALALVARNQLRNWQDSETLFAHAVRVTEGNYIALAGVGTVNYRRERYDEALQNLTQALECSPPGKATDQFKYYLGATLQKLGRGREALPYLEAALIVGELSPERDYRLGLSLLEAGRIAEAETALAKACDARPDNAEFQLGMAALLNQQQRPTDAERLLAKVVTTHPEMWLAHQALAEFLSNQGRLAQAERHYSKAVSLSPADVTLRRSHAACLLRLGQTDPGQRELEEALKLKPQDPQTCFELAEVLSTAGQTQRALELYEQTIRAAPNHIPALNNLAWLLATHPEDSLRDGKRAVTLAERACELTDWKQAVLMGTLAAAYAEAGRFPDAVTMAERARDRAREQKNNEVARRNEELIKLYQSAKPFRNN